MELVEELFWEEGIPVVWHHESFEEAKKRHSPKYGFAIHLTAAKTKHLSGAYRKPPGSCRWGLAPSSLLLLSRRTYIRTLLLIVRFRCIKVPFSPVCLNSSIY